MPTWDHFYFMDAASSIMSEMIYFHDHVMSVMTLIVVFLSYMIVLVLSKAYLELWLLQHHILEVVWTSFPGVLLLMVAFPSLHLLYLAEDLSNPTVTIKVVGHQWYWSYEFPQFSNWMIDSYMDTKSEFRLLDTSMYPIIPSYNLIHFLVSSTDVIHSWALPSMGLKIDAVPGRLNMVSATPLISGTFYGQCSEICGAYHSFSPIKLEVIPVKLYSTLIK